MVTLQYNGIILIRLMPKLSQSDYLMLVHQLSFKLRSARRLMSLMVFLHPLDFQLVEDFMLVRM